MKRKFPEVSCVFIVFAIFSQLHGVQLSTADSRSATTLEREETVRKFADITGFFSGSIIGITHMYFVSTGVTGYHGPRWKNYLTVAPSLVTGPIVGKYAVNWMTRQMLRKKLKPSHAIIPGILYGALCGTAICSACMAPILISGYLLDTIHFNTIKGNYMIPKLIGMSILGGAVYGGTIGAIAGSVYAPVISIYMKF